MSTIISQYISHRITDNINLYHSNQSAACHDNWPSSLFGLIQFMSMQKLASGHTVLQFEDSGEMWYEQIMEAVLPYLSEHLQDPSILHKAGMTQAVMTNAGESDTKALKAKVTAFIQEYQSKLRLSSAGVDQKAQLAKLLHWLLRFYYQVLHGLDFSLFVQHLAKNSLIGVIDQHFECPDDDTPLLMYVDAGVSKIYIWSNRAWGAERQILKHVERISRASVMPFDYALGTSELKERQKQAVQMVSHHAFNIITGGPGTGKTFTVAKMVLAMFEQNPHLNLALSAPTGKAAQRMSESLQAALNNQKITLPEPKTIHRLLGIGRYGTPRYTVDNPLPYDVIIIDEASMLGTEMACHVLAAVKTGARLILLGDANQLAAVDAGAVLADLCRALPQYNTMLTESQRFDDNSGVGRLAKLVNQDEQDGGSTHKFQQVCQIINQFDTLDFNELAAPPDTRFYRSLYDGYQDYFTQVQQCKYDLGSLDDDAKIATVKKLFDTLGGYRILCASHAHRCGDQQINQFITDKYRNQSKQYSKSSWYHGRVVMIRVNRYDLGLFNGDVGICLYDKGQLVVYFDGVVPKKVSTGLLSDDVASTAYAMTIHKSQGSEFTKVAIVFDEADHRLLSKELIYTAITRAKEQVVIHSTALALGQAISTPTVRATGLDLMGKSQS